MLLLNIITISASAGDVGLFYVRERTVAAAMLVKHVILESGIFLPEITEDEIISSVYEACSGTSVDPRLVLMLVKNSNGPYSIDFDGSVGLMRLKLPLASRIDPYILENNIRTGVNRLDVLLRKSMDTEQALYEYLMPVSRSALDKDREKIRRLAAAIYEEYKNSLLKI
jgi:hypothetical protein